MLRLAGCIDKCGVRPFKGRYCVSDAVPIRLLANPDRVCGLDVSKIVLGSSTCLRRCEAGMQGREQRTTLETTCLFWASTIGKARGKPETADDVQ